MLLIFNFNWNAFSIDHQVATQNKRLKELAKAEGVDQKIMFNCASMAGGEHILHSEKDIEINQITLDSLRHFHHRAKSELRKNEVFAANRDISEMLMSLRRSGHILAAVWADTTSQLEKTLEDTRVRDYFEDDVFGYDRRDAAQQSDLTYVGLYRTVTKQERVAPADTLVVSDDPVGVQEASYIKPRAIIGYVSPFLDNQTQKLRDMEAAGAHYAVTRANDVAVMPWRVSGVSGIRGSGHDFSYDS